MSAIGCVTIVVSCSTFPRAAAAKSGGGFIQKEDTLYTKLSYSYFRSTRFFNLEGEREGGERAFEKQILKLQAEYGLLEWLTLDASLPILTLNALEGSEQVSGIGDLRVGAMVGTDWAGFAFAAGLAVELPTGRDTAAAQVDGGDAEEVEIPTGDGEPNVWLRLGVSRWFEAIRTYVSLELVYNLRTENVLSEEVSGGFTDQVDAGLEVGHQLLERVWLTGWLRSLFTLGREPDRGLPFLYREGTEYLSGGGSASFEVVDSLSVRLEYSNIFALRRNVYGGSTFAGGITLKL